jgi:hypothetical protein
MPNPAGPERRKQLQLSQLDRDLLMQIKTTVEQNGKIVVDHEDRIRKTEITGTRHTMSLAGIWFAFTSAAGFFGLHLK